MQTVTLGLMAGTLVLSGLTMTSMRRLKGEISHLPEKSNGAATQNHPLLGVNVKEILPFPPSLNRAAIVMISSPSCPPCHKEMEEFVSQKDAEGVPFVCFANASKQEQLEKYLQKYANLVTIVPVEKDVIEEQLGVTTYPTTFFVDGHGIVQQVARPMKNLIRYFK